MTVRAVEGKQPYTGGTAIEIDENKVISLRLRDENNLIIYDAGDNEIYVDLQLPDGIKPNYAFPVGITTGRVSVDNDRDKTGTLICAKTTSGDNIKIFYADDGTLWADNGTGLFKQIYFKSDVDGIITTLTTYINGELAKKQNGVTSATAPTDPAEGDLWYDTTSNTLKVYNGSSWVATGGGSGDVVVSTDTGNELSTGVALWFGTESDYSSISTPDTNTLYIQYKSDGGGGFTPGVNTLLYAPLNGDVVDYSSYNRSFTVLGNTSAEGTPVFETLPSGIKVANFTATGGTDSNWLATTTNVTDIPSSGNMTISCWINRSGSTGTYEDFVSFRTEGGGYRADVYTWMCLVTNTNKLAFHGSSIKTSSEDATIGNRCNMMFVVDGANCYIYKNLTQIYSGGYNYGNRASNLTLGGYYSNAYSSNRNEAYNGKLSDVIIENKAWNSQERSNYYDLTKANYGIS